MAARSGSDMIEALGDLGLEADRFDLPFLRELTNEAG